MNWLGKLSEFMDAFIKGLSIPLKDVPLKDISTGIVVPLVSAFLSYFLVNRVSIRKEYNKLYIQLGLLKREFTFNKEKIQQFIQTYEIFTQRKKEIQLKLPFSQDLLYQVLVYLSKIEDDYFCFDNFVYEKPSCLVVLDEEIKKLEQQLEIHNTEMESLSRFNNSSLMQNFSIEIIKVERNIQSKTEELRNNLKRDIYKEFLGLQFKIDQSEVLEMYKEKEDDNLLNSLQYIYNCVNDFNKIELKDKNDIVNLYNNLLLYKIKKDEEFENPFEYNIFDLYYENRYGEHPMLNIWKSFHYYTALLKKFEDYRVATTTIMWNALKADLVLINDRELYIFIDDYYKDIELLNSVQNNIDEVQLLETNELCLKIYTKIEEIESNLRNIEMNLQKGINGVIAYHIKRVYSAFNNLIKKCKWKAIQ